MDELVYWQHALQRGQLSRRSFLGRAAALGASVALAESMAVRAEAQAAETAQRGGLLRLGLAGGSTTDSMDPRSYNDSVMNTVGHALFNSLVEWGQDGSPVPELAESWEVKPGAAEWIFNIRQGVTFSNGKTLDAADVVYSLNLHRGKTKSGATGPFKVIADIKALNARQVHITLTGGDADFAYVLTDQHVLMVPDGFTDWAGPVGTGGYTLERFDPGSRITGRRNPNYWRAGRAHVDAFDITVINDGTARLNALLTGQVDNINRVDPNAVKLIEQNPALELARAPGGWHTVISMMNDRAPFDNKDLRLALKYAIDREQIVKALFGGYGTVGNDHPIPRTDPYCNTDLPQFAYDADKAKYYFKKSGQSDPKIVLQASDAAFAGAVSMGELFQASAAKAGLAIELKKEPADGFWSNVWLKGACVTSYWAGRPAATSILGVAYGPGAPWNESHYANPQFGELLTAARAETDETKRRQMIFDMQALLHDDGATIVPAFRDWLDGNSVKLGGHSRHNGFDVNSAYIVEMVWLKG